MSLFAKLLAPAFLLNFVPPGQTAVGTSAQASRMTPLEQLSLETARRSAPMAQLSAQFGFVAWQG